MGPRKFVARSLTDFLLDHGHLDAQVRQIQVEQCLELQGSSSTVPWWNVLALSDAHHDHVYKLQTAAHHSAMLLIVSFVITYHMGKQKKIKRKGRVYTSHQPSRLSKTIEGISLLLASASLCLVALRIVLTTHQSLSSSSIIGDRLTLELRKVYSIDRIIGVLEEIPLRSQHLYTSSLWSVLISTFLMMTTAAEASAAAWSILDPTKMDNTTRTTWAWRSLGVRSTAENFAVLLSVGVVLWLAFIDLPIFHKIIKGEIQIDFGLPQALIEALKHTLFSFVGFCIFHQFLPRDTIIQTSAESNEGQVVKKPRKHAVNPEVVQRMSALAREARERVQDRKSGKKQLRRTYSMGDFKTSTPPPSTRRSLNRSSSTEKKHIPRQQYPPSPLLDIHLAGPTLSSKDLLAKLKVNAKLKRSVSTGCLFQVPKSILITTVPELPYLAEEEKVHEDDESASTPTHHPSTEDLTWRSNPQSMHTPVPLKKGLVL